MTITILFIFENQDLTRYFMSKINVVHSGISGAYFGHACWLYSERREVTQYVRFFLSVQTITNGSQEGSSNVEKHFPNCYADDNSNSSSQKVHKKFVKN